MPTVSPAQERLMQAAAHTSGGYGGVPQSVGKEFVSDDADFNESDHPRAENGEFSSGGGGSKSEKPSTLKKSPEDAGKFSAAKSEGVAIPPAWSKIEYYGKSGKDGIIATGTDGKGRKQRLEVPEYRAKLIAEKQSRIANNLSPKMPKITSDLRKSAEQGNESAKVLYLITQTGFRIGGKGDGKSEHEAFGASTITGNHVSVAGNVVHFKFPGKHGVDQDHEVNDPVIAKMMKNAKPGVPIFSVSDSKIRDEWKKYGGEKVHDIRSYVATETAKEALKSLIPPKPHTEKEMRKLQLEVAKVAAKKLGNRPEESLATYINPSIFAMAK